MNLRLRYLAIISTVLLALLLSNSGATTVPSGHNIVVDAGQWDRHNTIVSFPFKGGSGRSYLRDTDGTKIPLQFDGTTAWFVLPDLKAGKQRTFSIATAYEQKPQAGGVELTRVGNRLEIKTGGRIRPISEPRRRCGSILMIPFSTTHLRRWDVSD